MNTVKLNPMQYANKYGLRPADQIVEPITELGITKHFAIYLGCDEEGIEWVAENKKFFGVRVITAIEYFKDVKSIARVKPFTGSNTARRSVVEKALLSVGRPYNLFEYNCEHFANEVTTGKKESKQVQTATVLVGLLLLAAIID